MIGSYDGLSDFCSPEALAAMARAVERFIRRCERTARRADRLRRVLVSERRRTTRPRGARPSRRHRATGRDDPPKAATRPELATTRTGS